MKKQDPNLMLQRLWCHDDCTVGRLTDGNGQLICMTLEARWHEAGSPRPQGYTCVRQGVYRVAFGYDSELKYFCWKLTGHGLVNRVRLCFLAKDGSVAAHTRSDILVGYLCEEGDGEKAFDGRLYRPVEAFARLRNYYDSLRANHSNLVLGIADPPQPVQWLPAVAAPKVSTGQIRIEDYILQTL